MSPFLSLGARLTIVEIGLLTLSYKLPVVHNTIRTCLRSITNRTKFSYVRCERVMFSISCIPSSTVVRCSDKQDSVLCTCVILVSNFQTHAPKFIR